MGAHEEGATEKPEEHVTEAREEHEEKRIDAHAAAREEQARRIAERRAESEALRKESSSARSQGGSKGFTVEKRRPTIKKEELVGPEYYLGGERKDAGPPGKGGIQLTSESGAKVNLYPSRTTDIETTIKENYDVKGYAKGVPGIMGKLRDLIVKIAGDTPTHYVTDAEMRSITGGNSRGAYSSEGGGVIFLNTEHMSPSTPLHEAYHAAIAIGLKRQPFLRDLMERLRVEVRKNLPNDLTAEDKKAIAYYLSDHEEFVNGLLTNERTQELLKRVKISNELAKDIGIPRWRKMTMWEGALSVIRQALGLGPRDTSAIEAAMALSEDAMWQHPRATGDLLQASGRLAASEMKGDKWWKQEAAPERDQEAAVRSHRETLSRVRDIDAQGNESVYQGQADQS